MEVGLHPLIFPLLCGVRSACELFGAARGSHGRAGVRRCRTRTVAQWMLRVMARHGVLSVAMTDRIIGCPHQEGIDYHGQWCRSVGSGRDATASQVNACTEPLLTYICVLSLQQSWAMNSLAARCTRVVGPRQSLVRSRSRPKAISM